MDNNQFNQFNQTNPANPLKNSMMQNKQLLQYIGLGCACGGALLTFIFNIVTCAQSASKSASDAKFKMSLWIIGVIFAAILSIGGIVLVIITKEANAKLDKIAMITVIVAAVALVVAIIPNATICAYNCSLNDKAVPMTKDIGSYFK